MKNMRHSLLAIVLFTLFQTHSASAAEFGVLAGVNQTHQSMDTNYDSQSGFIGGVALNIPFALLFSVEADALFEHKNYNTALASPTYNAFQIPVLARFSVIPFLNFGAGIYYEFGVGDNNGLSGSDFGLASSIQLKVPFIENSSLVADARYLFGLRNLANDPATFKNREVNLMLGVLFEI